MTLAQLHGGKNWRDYLDIGPDYYVAAGIYNAVNDNTRATGNWAKGKVPKIDPWPTPNLAAKARAKAEARKPKSVADLYRRVQKYNEKG